MLDFCLFPSRPDFSSTRLLVLSFGEWDFCLSFRLYFLTLLGWLCPFSLILVEMQLANYVSGSRGSHAEDSDGQQMRAAAQLLRDDDAIKNVAAYIATLGR